MAHLLPPASHGDTLPVVGVKDKMTGKGDARQRAGVEYSALLLFDSAAKVPIVIKGADAKVTQADLTERNMKLDFVKARFINLVIEFSGGDYGAVRYSGTAEGIEIINPAPTAKPNS